MQSRDSFSVSHSVKGPLVRDDVRSVRIERDMTSEGDESGELRENYDELELVL